MTGLFVRLYQGSKCDCNMALCASAASSFLGRNGGLSGLWMRALGCRKGLVKRCGYVKVGVIAACKGRSSYALPRNHTSWCTKDVRVVRCGGATESSAYIEMSKNRKECKLRAANGKQ